MVRDFIPISADKRPRPTGMVPNAPFQLKGNNRPPVASRTSEGASSLPGATGGRASDPAVELEDLTGGVREAVVEMDQEFRDSFGGIEAVEDVVVADLRAAVIGERGGHRGVEEAGQDGVHADAGRAEFAGQRAGETEQAGLGRGVGGLAVGWMQGGAAGDENEVAATCPQHAAGGGGGADGGPAEVDRHDLVPCGFVEPGKRRVTSDARIADEEFGGVLAEESAHRVPIGNVQFPAAGAQHGMAGCGESRGQSPGEPPFAAGDDNESAHAKEAERNSGESQGPVPAAINCRCAERPG